MGVESPSANFPQEEPPWKRRMAELARQKMAEPIQKRVAENPEPVVPTRQSLRSAVIDATNAVEARSKPILTSRLQWTISVPLLFRLFVVFIIANLVGWAINVWSEAEGQRFPSISSDARYFPLIGPCSPTLFGALLVVTMNLAGLGGYAIARILEAFADDGE